MAKPDAREPGQLEVRVNWAAIKPTTADERPKGSILDADWVLYDDFATGRLGERKWQMDDRDPSAHSWTVALGRMQYDGRQPSVEFPPSLGISRDYLKQECAFPQGIAVEASLDAATSIGSYISIHSGSSDLVTEDSQYALGIVGGPGVGEVQARVRYINPSFDDCIGPITGLRPEDDHELTVIWDSTQMRFYADGVEIPLTSSVGQQSSWATASPCASRLTKKGGA